MMLFITASDNTRILMDWCNSVFSYFQYTTKSSEIVYNDQNVNMILYKCRLVSMNNGGISHSFLI